MRGNGNSMGSQMNGGAGPSMSDVCGVPLAAVHQCDPNDRGL